MYSFLLECLPCGHVDYTAIDVMQCPNCNTLMTVMQTNLKWVREEYTEYEIGYWRCS